MASRQFAATKYVNRGSMAIQSFEGLLQNYFDYLYNITYNKLQYVCTKTLNCLFNKMSRHEHQQGGADDALYTSSLNNSLGYINALKLEIIVIFFKSWYQF